MTLNRWQKAVAKLKHTLLPTHKLGYARESLIDSVKIDFSNCTKDRSAVLLNDISQGVYTNKEGYTYHRVNLTQKDLEQKHRLFYNVHLKILVDYNGEAATTIGCTSKNIQNTQAFILSKERKLYRITHAKDEVKRTYIVHSSFLNGQPAEMAGMLSIVDGKITMLNINSGHYRPENLDMYRCILILQKEMPGVLSPNSLIGFRTDNKIMQYTSLENFMNDMDYNSLRLQRVEHITQYCKNLKQAMFIVIDTPHTELADTILNLLLEEEKKLSNALKHQMVSVSVKTHNAKTKNFSIDQLMLTIINSNNLEALTKLFNIGIGKRIEYPMLKNYIDITIEQTKEKMLELILKHVSHNLHQDDINDYVVLTASANYNNSTEILLQRASEYAKHTTLCKAAINNNVNLIDIVFKYLDDHDHLHKLQALESCAELGHINIANKLLNIIMKNQSNIINDKISSYIKHIVLSLLIDENYNILSIIIERTYNFMNINDKTQIFHYIADKDLPPHPIKDRILAKILDTKQEPHRTEYIQSPRSFSRYYSGP